MVRLPRWAFAITGLLPLIAALLLWQATGPERSISYPRPSTWLVGLQDMLADGTLLSAVTTTVVTFAVAVILAIPIGAALGMLMGASDRVDRALTPIMDFFRSLPPPAVVPVLGLILGLTPLTNVVIVVVAVVWPILLNTATGMRSVPRVRLDMARTLALSPSERLFKIVVPSVAPSVMVGVRIAASSALIVTLLIDMLGTGDGLGRQLMLSQQRFQAGAVWGLLLITGLVGYLLNVGIGLAEHYAFRNWPQGLRG
jgi:ABC-type nitrate/sulfonate/bicarbonate transport system permease component